MLCRYEPKEQILHISGYQAFDYKQPPSYYFSAFPGISGWATWRRAWAHYSGNPDDYQQWMGSEEMKRDMPHAYIRAFWQLILEKMCLPGSKLRSSSWAYWWALSVIKNRGLCISPSVSTVKNIGFDSEATHTKKSIAYIHSTSLKFLLTYELSETIDIEKDWNFFRHQFVDTNWKFFKIILKRLFPFLKPLS